MKIAAFALTTLLSMALLFGFVFGIVASDDELSTGALIATVTAITAFIIAGLMAGFLLVTSGRDPRTEDGRRFFRRGAIILGVLVTGAVVALVSAAVVGPVSPATVAVFLASGLLYVALNVIGGEYLRRRDDRLRPTRPTVAPFDEPTTRRRMRTASTIFVVLLAVGVLTTIVVSTAWGDASDVPPLLGLSVLFAALGAAFVSLNAVMRLNTAARELIGTDAARGKRIGRHIRGHDAEVSDEEHALAVRYAPLGRSLLGWNIAQFTLLHVGLLAQNLGRLLGEDSDLDVLYGAVSVVLVAVGAALIPHMAHQYRTIGRFIATHVDTATAAIGDDGGAGQSTTADHSPR
ncbi:hypothetical protein CLV49_0920 [Labedella gwakjiensis]|uniref:Uncharacterized protein n=1 Tax=Labedella gwakjiensis TaxID=390269 RepID=A0A2P8GTL3_9MICO|nr:hypothetical protein [Labedella gwakjiensis]PSL37313.1 hypothetical protein CLV49_0920 [Labedella gwakjiensis]RUQ84638.1 hypothetical protein ELQ93_13635 [Labedella gwakjiensis]